MLEIHVAESVDAVDEAERLVLELRDRGISFPPIGPGEDLFLGSGLADAEAEEAENKLQPTFHRGHSTTTTAQEAATAHRLSPPAITAATIFSGRACLQPGARSHARGLVEHSSSGHWPAVATSDSEARRLPQAAPSCGSSRPPSHHVQYAPSASRTLVPRQSLLATIGRVRGPSNMRILGEGVRMPRRSIFSRRITPPGWCKLDWSTTKSLSKWVLARSRDHHPTPR